MRYGQIEREGLVGLVPVVVVVRVEMVIEERGFVTVVVVEYESEVRSST